MEFHDIRGMLDAWHNYWEECGCEALEREKGWPRPLDSRHVSALLYMQWERARDSEAPSPLDDYGAEIISLVDGKGEVKAGDRGRMLELLEKVELPAAVSIRLLNSWERTAIARWARVVEYLEEKKKKRKQRWNKAKVMNKSVKECEGLAMAAERATDGMARLRSAKWWNEAERARKREKEFVKKNEAKVVESRAEERNEVKRPLVELTVIRAAPNPRIVVCEYYLLAERLVVKLKVKSNLKFVRGMKIKMEEQLGEEWEYHGTLPTHKGRW